MDIIIHGDRGKLSLSKVGNDEDCGEEIELGLIYDDEEYFMQVGIDELERALAILKKEKD